MRLNTMKGILAERLLRRFRFQLVSRMMRFPRSYFQNTSQGELVSMVTSEAEPMGGLMGDAVAQPVFQAGQMIIIVVFLFLQSVWFGLAGVALIPLQAWVLPMLQRQIHLLTKERIVEVRHFAAEIGETAAGINDLRANGGWRWRLATFTDRLGRLFDVRFRIYQKKFFMKFLNNFITQMTPFFFYAAGG
jgi:putative ABC transport system ATP-binding protein